MRARQKIESDPRVESVWDESDSGDGLWVNLRPGFADLSYDPWQPTHTIHEWTWKEIKARMKQVKPCLCSDCAPNPKG